MPADMGFTAYDIALRYLDEYKEAFASLMGNAKTLANPRQEVETVGRLASSIVTRGIDVTADAFVREALEKNGFLTPLDRYLPTSFRVQANLYYQLEADANRRWFAYTHSEVPVRRWDTAVRGAIISIISMVFARWKNRFHFQRAFLRLALFEVIEYLSNITPPTVRQHDLIKLARTHYLRMHPTEEEPMRISGWFAYIEQMSTAKHYVEVYYNRESAFHWAYRTMKEAARLGWQKREDTNALSA